MEEAKKLVCELLVNDNTGYDNNHIKRVYDLSNKFAEKEGTNKEIVGLALSYMV